MLNAPIDHTHTVMLASFERAGAPVVRLVSLHWSETCLGSGPDPVAGVDPCLGGVKLESMAWI